MSMNQLMNTPNRVIEKTEEDKEHIRSAVKNNFLFSSLDKEQMKIVVDAMERKVFKKNDVIIKQGESSAPSRLRLRFSATSVHGSTLVLVFGVLQARTARISSCWSTASATAT
jgi:hypothetical protein